MSDTEGIVQFWNPAAESLFGFAAHEVLGQTLDVIVPPPRRQAHWAGFRRAIAEGRPLKGNMVRTTRSLHRDGRRMYVDMSFGIVIGDSGRVEGAVAVARDCTDRYLAEKARLGGGNSP